MPLLKAEERSSDRTGRAAGSRAEQASGRAERAVELAAKGRVARWFAGSIPDVTDAELAEDGMAVLDALEPTRTVRGGLIRSGAIAGGAVLASNLMNVGFQLGTARLLPPAEYSLLVSLFSVLLIMNVPILSLQARVARDVAHAVGDGAPGRAGALLVDSLGPLVRWGAIMIAIGALAIAPLSLFFNVERLLPIAALLLAVLVTVPLPVSMGGLQGMERFPTLAGVQILYAVLKLAVGLALAAAGFGAAAIVAGIALATVASFVVSLIPLRKLFAAGLARARGTIKLLDGYTTRAAVTLVLIAALTNLDLIAARLFLPDHEAGLYAAAGVAARALLLLPTIATTVLFPRVATLRDLTAERHHLLGGLAAVLALGIVPLALFLTIPEPLLDIGFGSDYVDAQDLLGPLGIAMMLYALVEVYAFHFLALGKLGYGAVLAVGAVLLVVLLAVFHDSGQALIDVQIVVATVLLVLSELYDRFSRDPQTATAAGIETAPAGGQ